MRQASTMLPLLLFILLSIKHGVGVQEACTASLAPDGEKKVEWFQGIKEILYEGPASKNPLSFKYYNPSERIAGRTMREWLRFSLSFWHTMRGDGSDPFGSPTKTWPWEDPSLPPLDAAKRRLDVFFEILDKLGAQFWCFHDRDIAPEGSSVAESDAWLEEIAGHARKLQGDRQGRVQLLWGTAQLFKHPRYVHGAATSPNATVFARAAAQVKKAMEVTNSLGGSGYVFWGGREGYSTLLNTDMKLETDNLARFLRMAASHAEKIGFKGNLMLEPKPQEPSKHQYDFDAATTHAFLQSHGLQGFKLNIECNHATLAGHSCFHELTYASDAGLLGSVDANTGDPQVGWDTDEFLTDVSQATLVALAILRNDGLAPGGLNFDAKLRRESTDPEDLFIAHIAGMDAMARGLRNAAALIEDGTLDAMRKARYADYSETQLGKDIMAEKIGFEELAQWAKAHDDPVQGLPSGKQELYEMAFNSFVR